MVNDTIHTQTHSSTPTSEGRWASLMAFLHKEFLHVFRDKRTLLVMFGLPIAQILIFGFALTNEVKNARLLIVSPVQDTESKKLIEKIDASSYFTVTHIVPTRQNLEHYFRNNEAQCALILPDDFSASGVSPSQVQIVADATDPNFAKTVVFYLSAILGEFQQQSQPAQSIPMAIKTEVRMLYNPSLMGAMNFVPGVIALIMMIVCTTLTSISIVREKETGTMETLLVSPLKPFLLIISKAIPYTVLSLVNLSFILLLSNLVLDVPIRGSVILLLFECLLYIIACLALGLMISNIASSQAVAMMISMAGILLPTLLLTGFLFPLENMPWIFQWLSNVVPARWFFIIVKSIMLKGVGLEDVWLETTVLIGMTVFLLAVSLKRFKIRLE